MPRSGTALRTRGLSYTPAGAPAAVLEKIDLELFAGECALLTGPSGSGKSTLLRALAGLLRDGRGEGLIELSVASRPGCLDVGLVSQNAESQLLCTTVSDEIDFGLGNLGVAPEQRALRAAAALAAVGLGGFERRGVERLSAGEQQRVTLAALLALEPAVLLLDEPTAQLDRDGCARLVQTLRGLLARGHALLVAEHDPEPFRALASRWLRLEHGVLELAPGPPAAETPATWQTAAPGATAFELAELCLLRPDGGVLIDRASLKIRRGERVHLLGANGSGKTSLLRACVGLAAAASGGVRVDGLRELDPARLSGHASLLFQNPERQLFEATVRDEIGFGLRRAPLDPLGRKARVEQALRRCDCVPLADRSPLALSHGEQHRVALACALAPQPALLLLDEPFAGLDLAQRRRLLCCLAQAARDGAAVVIASHAELADPGWAQRRLRIEPGGRLVER